MFPIKPGSCTKAVPGYDIHVLDAAGAPVEANQIGNVVVKLPLPPGCLPTLWNNDERYISSYLSAFPGYYLTADAGFIDDDGYISIMGRTDDIINVAGHRLSTAGMEEVIAKHPDVAECAVIGIEDSLKGHIPVGFVVLKEGADTPESEIESVLVQKMRKDIGAVASFKRVAVTQRLPKTRSGKILRKIMRYIADGKEFRPPSTIENPAVLDEIRETMESHGIGKAFMPAEA